MKLTNVCSLVLVAVIILLPMRGADKTEPSAGVQPVEGYVPDEITAMRIAEAVLIPIFGEERVKNQKPFIVVLQEGIWNVRAPVPESAQSERLVFGGTLLVRIDKEDGRILSAYEMR